MTTRIYETRGWVKTAEEDIYDDGCQPDSARSTSGSDVFTGETQRELIDKLMEFADVGRKYENVLINSCGEMGRIDIQSLETTYGNPASDFEIDEWKKGRVRLWDVTYLFRVEYVAREIALIEKDPERNYSEG